MCEYCDGSKRPIETEVDGEAYMVITPDNSEYPEGLGLDVYGKCLTASEDAPWYSFIVPRCPMCGKTAGEVLG